MKRLSCLLLLVMPLTGCAGFDGFTACGAPEPVSPCANRPAPVNVCGVVQTSGSLPPQTAEPPR